eukprot:352763-Chlamydomonas_euryale.AAC.1
MPGPELASQIPVNDICSASHPPTPPGRGKIRVAVPMGPSCLHGTILPPGVRNLPDVVRPSQGLVWSKIAVFCVSARITQNQNGFVPRHSGVT